MRKIFFILIGFAVICTGCDRISGVLKHEQKKVEEQMDDEVKKRVDGLALPGQEGQKK